MIEQISIGDFKKALEIFDDVKKNMQNNGIDQWDELYPNSNIINDDIQRKVAFGYFQENQLVGYIVIDENFNEEYNDVDWKFQDTKPLIVHRLAVKSQFQGKGIAKKLMQFAETKGRQDGYNTMRLDTFSLNPKALNFYKTLNYRLAGEVIFRKGLFYCFEKKL